MNDTAKLIERLSTGEGKQVNTLTLAQELMQEFGGAKGLAREAKHTYDEAPEGSQNRIRLLAAIVELVNKAHPMQEHSDPLAGLTQEELQSAVLHVIQNESSQFPPTGPAP